MSANQFISWALILMNDGALVERKDNYLKRIIINESEVAALDVELTG